MAQQSSAAPNGSTTCGVSDSALSGSRDVAWYVKELKDIPEAAREVLEEYSKIPPEKVHDHIYQVRERAWDIWPFPCLGGWRFLDLNLRTMPQYTEIVSRIQNGEMLLDLGCCFGQELRRLIFDGAPADKLYGTDLRPEFFDLGYDLFLDRETCKSSFIAADLFEEPEELMALSGQLSIVYAGAFFHLFDRAGQLHCAKLVTRLLKAEPGSMVLGRQVGSVIPGLHEHGTDKKDRMYRHDETTWREMWEEAGRDMGVSWQVEVELVDAYKGRENLRLGDENVRQLRFCVRRL